MEQFTKEALECFIYDALEAHAEDICFSNEVHEYCKKEDESEFTQAAFDLFDRMQLAIAEPKTECKIDNEEIAPVTFANDLLKQWGQS